MTQKLSLYIERKKKKKKRKKKGKNCHVRHSVGFARVR